jgi:hypothetical protein
LSAATTALGRAMENALGDENDRYCDGIVDPT